MKKAIFSALLIAGISTASFAQDVETVNKEATSARVQLGSSPEEMAKIITERIHAIVNLNPDQYAKVLEIAKKINDEPASATNSAAGTSKDDAAGAQVAVRTFTQRLEKIKTVLTPEQVKKLEAASAGEGAAGQQRMSTATPIKSRVSE